MVRNAHALMDERFLYLVKQRLAKHDSSAESRELEELLRSNNELQQIYQVLFSASRTDREDDLLEAEQSYAAQAVRMHLDGAFEKGREPQNTVFKQGKLTKSRLMTAAVCVLIIAVPIQLYFMLSGIERRNSLQTNQVGTKKGSKSHIVLPDGSSVWLNSDSKITYADNFEGDTREVTLEGEAFFDVVRNPSKPFIIHTGAMDVKVLGTEFNVRSYPTETTTETALLRGLIEVTLHGNEKKKIILKPNEKLTVLNSEENSQPPAAAPVKKYLQEDIPLLAITKIHYNRKDSSNAETSWVNNSLAFDNEKIDRVLSKIEQWYNVEIVVEDENIQSKHFTATFGNKSLKEVMEALALSLSFKYEEKNGKINIR